MYFYQSRYFDAYLNRWIQPDSIIPDQGNVLDWDRYSYARNNPLKYTDPDGHRPDDGCREDGCNIDDRVIEEENRRENEWRQRNEYVQCWGGNENHCSTFDNFVISLDNFDIGDITVQIGFGGNLFFPVGVRGDFALALDGKGNLAILATLGGGGYNALGGGTGPYFTTTNAPSVQYLEGWDVQVGAQNGQGETVGAEKVFFLGPERQRFHGTSISAKAELQGPWPGELHTTVTHTWIIDTVNIPDLIVNPFRP